jgi:hypothetical protein
MPTLTPPTIPGLHVSGVLARQYVYGENNGTPYAYTMDTRTPHRLPPSWDMSVPANQVAAVYLDLTPAERATWLPMAKRKNLPLRTRFASYNLKRFNHYTGKPGDIRRTAP